VRSDGARIESVDRDVERHAELRLGLEPRVIEIHPIANQLADARCGQVCDGSDRSRDEAFFVCRRDGAKRDLGPRSALRAGPAAHLDLVEPGRERARVVLAERTVRLGEKGVARGVEALVETDDGHARARQERALLRVAVKREVGPRSVGLERRVVSHERIGHDEAVLGRGRVASRVELGNRERVGSAAVQARVSPGVLASAATTARERHQHRSYAREVRSNRGSSAMRCLFPLRHSMHRP
jgi:hypothetical protein